MRTFVLTQYTNYLACIVDLNVSGKSLQTMVEEDVTPRWNRINTTVNISI